MATDAAGNELWENRFEPFGRDMDQGQPWSALENEMFLRFPGQWEDEVWQEATMGAEVLYNVHRWYQTRLGRYSRVDPILRLSWEVETGRIDAFLYASSNPVLLTDPVGLLALSPGTDCENFGDILDGLKKLAKDPCCNGFFGFLGADLSSILGGAPPFLKTFPAPGANTFPQRRGVFLCELEPNTIQITDKVCKQRRFFNPRRVRRGVVFALHELHYVDCNYNNNEYPGEEGQVAEKVCLGKVISGDIN